MSETTPKPSAKSARKEILGMLDDLQKACGDKMPVSDMLTWFTRKAYHEIFGLADELRGALHCWKNPPLAIAACMTSPHLSPRRLCHRKRWPLVLRKSTRGVPGTPNSGFKLMHKTPVARGAK
jgi:hypothetical protein